MQKSLHSPAVNHYFKKFLPSKLYCVSLRILVNGLAKHADPLFTFDNECPCFIITKQSFTVD